MGRCGPCACRRLKLLLARPVLARYERRLLTTATRVHVLSRFMADWLGSTYGDAMTSKVALLPWWCEKRRSMSKTEARSRLGLATNEAIVFTVRRLVRRTGVDVLLRAIDFVDSPRPFRVLVAGDGPERGRLEGLAAAARRGSAQMLGPVTQDRLDLLFQAADMFVLPTRELECFGLVTLDALGYGCPVIGTRDGATPELLGPALNDFLVAPGSATALGAKLSDFLDGRLVHPPPDRLAAEAQQKYTAAGIHAAFLGLLHQLAASPA